MAQHHRKLAREAESRAMAELHVRTAERFDGKARKAEVGK